MLIEKQWLVCSKRVASIGNAYRIRRSQQRRLQEGLLKKGALRKPYQPPLRKPFQKS